MEIVLPKNIKFHDTLSFCLNFFGEGNQRINTVFLFLQQCNLLLQRLFWGKGRVIQHGADLPQRKLQFPEKQNTAQTAQRGIVVETVARFRGL